MSRTMRLKRGDTVKVISGDDSGKTGLIERALPQKGRLVVAGVNVVKKHIRKSALNPGGGIKQFGAPIDWSNVMLVCPACKKLTRVAIKRLDGKGYRQCKRCQTTIQSGKSK